MKIVIETPEALHEIGGRDNNEDSIYPSKGSASNNDSLFLVCDGVGGAEKGEIASQTVCSSIPTYFQENPTESVNDLYIDNAVQFAQNQIDHYIEQNPGSKGMGTTMTLLSLNDDGATASWCGDSRIYHIRVGKIKFVSTDHSLVNELIKAGVISEEEAKDHPQKNVITRALQGISMKKVKAETIILTDIKPGDYFFLCSDGILEKITDTLLLNILNENMPDRDKIEKIKGICDGQTRDNFSAYLIHIKNVEGTNIIHPVGASEKITSEDKTHFKVPGKTLHRPQPIGGKRTTYPKKPINQPRIKRKNIYKTISIIFGLLFFVSTIALIYVIIDTRFYWEEKSAEPNGTQTQEFNEPNKPIDEHPNSPGEPDKGGNIKDEPNGDADKSEADTVKKDGKGESSGSGQSAHLYMKTTFKFSSN